MTDDLAAKATDIAVQMDSERLAAVVDRLRAEATDVRTARRLVEKQFAGPLSAALQDLFTDSDFPAALHALDAASRTAKLIREELGHTGLVWTGPGSRTIQKRATRSVVDDLINRARASLTLVTYAGHDIDELVTELDEARLERGVTIRIVLETKEDSPHQEGPSPASAFKHLPLAIPVYRWPIERRGAKGGSMHVKCVIRDRSEALVTSANLTSAALDRNMELGVLIDGGPVPRLIDQHYDDLVDSGELVRL